MTIVLYLYKVIAITRRRAYFLRVDGTELQHLKSLHRLSGILNFGQKMTTVMNSLSGNF
jgi:hypothetical protein